MSPDDLKAIDDAAEQEIDFWQEEKDRTIQGGGHDDIQDQ